MFVTLVLNFGLLACAFAKTELSLENNVAVLTKENFDKVVDEYDYVMVEFYAPWCGHCKMLKPEYEKAAEMLKETDLDVLVAKVDATVETELASAHDVTGYPTLKFHKNGTWIPYNGDRTAQAIRDWVLKKSGPALRQLETVKEVEDLVKSVDVAVVGFIKTADRQVLQELAEEMDGVTFGIVDSQDVFDKYGIKKESDIVVFKSFDDGRVSFEGPINKQKLSDFIQIESIKSVEDFSQEVAQKIFGSPLKNHFVAFVPMSGPYKEIKSTLEKVARSFKHKAHFVMIDTDKEEHLRILEFFGLSESDIPSYRFVNLADDVTKFKPDSSEFSEEAIGAFVNGVLSGSIKPFLMSQDIPTEDNGPVRVLVGKNYNAVTQDPSKAVFVKLYAPWCKHCQNLAPIWEKIGETFKDQDDIIIAKMDSTANEVDGLKVISFPTIKYYPKGSSEGVDYTGDRTFEALKQFLDSEGKTETFEKSEDTKDEL